MNHIFTAITNYFFYDCHFRGSITSNVITSSKPNQEQACAEHNMEAGKTYPMFHTCFDEDGNIEGTVFSSLSAEEACAGAGETLERLVTTFCQDNENP